MANVASFRFSFRGEHANVVRTLVPVFRSGGTSESTLVPVFVPGEHPPKTTLLETTLLGSSENPFFFFRHFQSHFLATSPPPPGEAKVPGRNYIRPPPFPHFWLKGIFQGRGVGGVYFEAPRGRNFIRPPPLLYTPHPWKGIFRGGGVGVYKIWPREAKVLFFRPVSPLGAGGPK